MKNTVILLISLFMLPPLAASAAESGKAARPNIVFILADDLGLDGVSCYGADKRKTPQIDKLASTGMRFETCYAAPLCGPSRCALMSGRYAFRTGGLTNGSWRAGGPGAKSADEQPIARLLKQGGYATGMAGKWRQVGETPADWGFDEYTTDPTAGGWFWQNKHTTNGKEVTVPDGTYAPDYIQNFTVDFLRRHKDQPFYFYYSMHLVHGPILHTADSAKGAKDGAERYDDNIAYMDKQVGQIVAQLEKLGLREKTLLMFSGDNGTALTFPATIGGRMINGKKASMLEGGSRVPLIASWPGVTPAGKVNKDIVNFTDMHATFLELAGAQPPANFKFDSRSIAPQLRGEAGTPREWAFVQLGAKWFVREQGWKLDQAGELFDMSDAPFVEKPVAASADTDASKAARARLTAVLAELNPAAGKTDGEGGAKKGGAKKKAAKKAAGQTPSK
ncbi:sulfatase-like hydrolase/transferase [Humisphaera borealis]|uniref:Sulfatase-like hydrolase/transferase n=1 Tax=Humisphaera borealis TaxID=2807512 RepID=A0A7M2WRK8_9BACT|nr:sulfatase-like hydrolase/transferase [Humisphaera borealis]QOV88029.1 sulfatase-like hydrolase/transferase [Humisphaera borealis]